MGQTPKISTPGLRLLLPIENSNPRLGSLKTSWDQSESNICHTNGKFLTHHKSDLGHISWSMPLEWFPGNTARKQCYGWLKHGVENLSFTFCISLGISWAKCRIHKQNTTPCSRLNDERHPNQSHHAVVHPEITTVSSCFYVSWRIHKLHASHFQTGDVQRNSCF